jgi:hypothetical protein
MPRIPRLRVGLLHRTDGAAVAGVVEQDVEPAEFGLGAADGGFNVGFLGHVAVGVDHLAGKALLQHRAFLVLHVGGHHLRALGHE